MQRTILAAVAALAAASLACSINLNLPDLPRIQTGPEQTFTVAEAAPAAADVVDVNLNMGVGELTLAGGASGLLEGEIRYNVAEWEPTLTSSGSTVTLTQGDDDNFESGLPGDNTVNDWNLKLGETVPMNLNVNAGAYEGNLELGGVPLRRLEIRDGASHTEVNFDAPNPEAMDRLVYETGASSVTLTGLANANFEEMEFKGGAGDYDLDFSGDLQRAASVQVVVGLSSLRISIPAGTNVRVEVGGGLHDVDTQGSWSANNDTYETSGTGPLLTIEVDMGAGSLTLVSQ
jgi:N-terminal domain of toast_rack, DUF2154